MRVCDAAAAARLLDWGCCDAWQHIEMHSTQCNAAQLVRFSSSQCRFPTIWDTVAIVTHRRANTASSPQSSVSASSSECCCSRLGFMSTSYTLIHTVAQKRHAQLHSASSSPCWLCWLSCWRVEYEYMLWIWHAWLARHSCNLKLFAHWIRTLHSVSLYTPHTMAAKFHFNLVLYTYV